MFLSSIFKTEVWYDRKKYTALEEGITLINIRREEPKDYEVVENIIRDAFYNIYTPGCAEHYLAHIMRRHTPTQEEFFILSHALVE